MGWEGYHLHLFTINDKYYSTRGVPGYYALLKALKNPEDKNDADWIEWAEGWDPDDFNINEVNKSLADLGKKSKNKEINAVDYLF